MECEVTASPSAYGSRANGGQAQVRSGQVPSSGASSTSSAKSQLHVSSIFCILSWFINS